jgi:outer membrane protein OmpU
MKKVLIASTALVAATMLSAGAASASEKIKLELGGFSKWWVVGAWQDNSFQATNNAAGVQGDYNNVDIKGDNEIFFGGETTLDNGLKVGVMVELEAGGSTDNRDDTIDKSFAYVEGGFGKVIIGSEANGAALLHVMAPDAAGNIDSDGLLTGGLAIAVPDAVTYSVTTAIDTDSDAEKITYVSPTFYGFTAGATLYANTFGPVGVKVSGGWATYDINQTTQATPGPKDGVQEWSTGAQLTYGNFTIGGSYRNINSDAGAAAAAASVSSGDVWDAGIQYASGPYAVSFYYLNSKRDGTAAAGEDEAQIYQVSGKYSMGPGVDLLATIGHAEFEDESGLAQNENKGWSVMSGLSLAF